MGSEALWFRTRERVIWAAGLSHQAVNWHLYDDCTNSLENAVSCPVSIHPVQHLYPVGIQLDKDKQQDGERPQGGTAIAEKRQGDTHHREKTYGHGNIDGEMEEQERYYTVAVYPCEACFLSFR